MPNHVPFFMPHTGPLNCRTLHPRKGTRAHAASRCTSARPCAQAAAQNAPNEPTIDEHHLVAHARGGLLGLWLLRCRLRWRRHRSRFRCGSHWRHLGRSCSCWRMSRRSTDSCRCGSLGSCHGKNLRMLLAPTRRRRDRRGCTVALEHLKICAAEPRILRAHERLARLLGRELRTHT